jgi:hypothetical protein
MRATDTTGTPIETLSLRASVHRKQTAEHPGSGSSNVDQIIAGKRCLFKMLQCARHAHQQGQFDDVMERLQPALKRLTWESLNIDSFLSHLRQGLDQLEGRIFKINQITEHVLENNLRQISCTVLVHVPANESFSLSRFLSLQKEWIRKGSTFINEKSKEMEARLSELTIENKALADLTHVHSKSDMLQEVFNPVFFSTVSNITHFFSGARC